MIKGCCASLCQGLVLVFSAFNILGALGVLAVGCYLTFDFTSKALGYHWFGLVIILCGASILSVSILGLYGAFKELRNPLQIGFFVAMLNTLLLMIVVGFCMFSSGAVKDGARETWFMMPQEERQQIETKMSCCGFDDIADSTTPNCKFHQPCQNSFTAHVTSWLKSGVTIGGIALVIHIMTGAFVGCLWLGVGSGGRSLSKAEKQAKLSDEVKAELKKQKYKDIETGHSRRGSDAGISRHYDKRDAHRYE